MAIRILKSFLLAMGTLLVSQSYLTAVAAAEDILILGARDDAPPFSWKHEGKYKGFSVRLCREIEKRAKESGAFSDVQWKSVDARNRFEALNAGEIDILCGATTVTLERMRPFDFTFFTFLSGASYMYLERPDSPDFKDWKGKKIGVLNDTTTEELLRRRISDMLGPSIDLNELSIIPVDNHFDSIRMLEKHEIDVYFADREILLALQTEARDNRLATGEKYESEFRVSNRYLSYEPYALAVRRDRPDLLFLANQTLLSMFRDKSIFVVFKETFPGKVMSRSLKQVYLLQQVPDGIPVQGLTTEPSS